MPDEPAPKCANCLDVGWVCENHQHSPWDRRIPSGCECGCGVPCTACNLSGIDAPRLPAGFKADVDKDGHRH